MLVSRIKDPALSELDNKITCKLREHRIYLQRAETDPSFLSAAEAAYEDMNALLDLRSRSAAKRESQAAS